MASDQDAIMERAPEKLRVPYQGVKRFFGIVRRPLESLATGTFEAAVKGEIGAVRDFLLDADQLVGENRLEPDVKATVRVIVQQCRDALLFAQTYMTADRLADIAGIMVKIRPKQPTSAQAPIPVTADHEDDPFAPEDDDLFKPSGITEKPGQQR